ncbi:anti-sigma-I factor RsgI family protein [Clostridium sp. Marseille-P2415]|uniref:anti-sigma-I factor RsgI family protein n=1 Tax=Clostridium sp. Marseille-P2415 TaxID=1805471 RepID=UPI0009887047|nr:anti-sigma factor domain-containing protein [Clostridium sp. Marseille-P2415]
MKSVVVEIKGRFAAVLSDDGSIKKIKNKNYAVGQEIQITETVSPGKIPGLLIRQREDGIKMKNLKKSVLCTVCVAVMLLCSGVGVWAYETPYSYVSLDVNPSIEYTLNRFKRVIRVYAVNDDGQAILNEIGISDLNHKSIEDAIMATVRQISKKGYFTGGNASPVTATASEAAEDSHTGEAPANDSVKYMAGGIVITVSSGNAELADEFVIEIREAVSEFVNENVEVEVSSVGLERVEEARELGVTPGKLNLVKKLRAGASDPESIVIEEWLNKPVKDIMKEIKKNRKAADTDHSEIPYDKATDSSAKAKEPADVSTLSGKDDESTGKTKKEKAPEKGQEKSDSADKTNGSAKPDSEIKVQNKVEKGVEKAESKAEKAEAKEQSMNEKEKENAITETPRSTESSGKESNDKTGNNKNNSGAGKEKQESSVKKSNSGNSKKDS